MQFIFRRFLVFSLLVLIGFSCSSNAKKSSENIVENTSATEVTLSEEKPEKYAETTITINGKKQKFRFKERNKDQVFAIKRIIESGQKLGYYKSKLIDVTGEGSLDTVEVRIDRIGTNEFRLSNSIFTHGKYVWQDSLDFKESMLEYYFTYSWDKDSNFYYLLPHSYYYEAFKMSDNSLTLEKFNFKEWTNDEGNKSMFEYATKQYLIKKDIIDNYITFDKNYTEIFKGYQGHSISILSHEAGNVEIWFEPTQEFFEIYAP